MGMQSGGRRSGGSGSGTRQHNGGFGYHAGGSKDVTVAREMIEGPGMRIYDPAARYGNSTFVVEEALFEVGRAVIDGQLGIQQIGLKFGDMDAVEFTEVSFRDFSAQPAGMRGGIYTRLDATNTVEAELISTDQSYDDWGGGIRSIRRRVDMFYRRPVGLWWVPSVVSQIPLKFEVSVWGMTRWIENIAGSQEQ